MAKQFEIFIEDVGDESVGLRSEITFKAELSESFEQHLKENKIRDEFEQRLEKLVKEFFEPETGYRTYDTDELEAEREYYEKLEQEGKND